MYIKITPEEPPSNPPSSLFQAVITTGDEQYTTNCNCIVLLPVNPLWTGLFQYMWMTRWGEGRAPVEPSSKI